MKLNKVLSGILFAGLVATMFPASVMAIGGASGTKTDYINQGQIGEVVMNPYDIAPLTAIIKNGGYVLENVQVNIIPKEGGQAITYRVADKHLRTYGGIPVFGLYPDYVNKVDVSYDRIYKEKRESLKETYTMYAPPLYAEVTGLPLQKGVMFSSITVKHVSPEFKDRLYFVNNLAEKSGKGTRVVWNNPTGGALEWNYYPQNFIIDTQGEVRWYMLATPIYNLKTIYHAGVMMGFKQNDDGAMSWGYGQRYAKYDILGREIFNRELPASYNDFSHFMDNAANGHYFIRAANANYKRDDGKNVRTVRDVIVEVDENGNAVDDWRLYDILDPYRDVVLKVLDQGAVCLNIDNSKAGQTITKEELAALDSSDQFGDIVGTGAGRNWAHVNSVDYDTEDDSIIISSRHQSAVVKIGRDKKVKWILSSPEGWRKDFQDKILTPIDANGGKIKCENSKCEGDFDWTWTQHTAFKIDAKSKGNILYLSVFDNGDSRGMEQPLFPMDKYSRAVVYKIDQKQRTVQQIWQYGKEKGHEWYSPVTSLVEFQQDKNSLMVYSATAGSEFDLKTGAFLSAPSPYINEFSWNPKSPAPQKEPAVEIQIHDAQGYQAFPFSLLKAFE